MKQWIKRITGVADIEAEVQALKIQREKEQADIDRLQVERATALAAAEQAKADEELAKLSPKERADQKQEPWISVLDTKINADNIRNGFFELDWNEYFIKELIANGYGTDADPQEEIVDRWFRDIVFNMFAEEGLDTQRGSGYINVVPISKGKSEVS
jgi:hypothetical protein